MYILILGTSNIGLGERGCSVALKDGCGLLGLMSGVNTVRGRIKACPPLVEKGVGPGLVGFDRRAVSGAASLKPALVSENGFTAGFFSVAAGTVASGVKHVGTDVSDTSSCAGDPHFGNTSARWGEYEETVVTCCEYKDNGIGIV